MPRLKLTLAYQGTRYAGWQLQAPVWRDPSSGLFCAPGQDQKSPAPSPKAAPSSSDAKLPQTIQGELESCVARILGVERIPIHGAGRTDSGVHAEGQVCHLDLPAKSERIGWRQALNTYLPHDIRITGAAWVSDDFHARESALGKRYAYSLWMSQDKALPRIAPFVWSTPVPDLDAATRALPLLTGRHDFASFQNSGSDIIDTVRTLRSITISPGTVAGLSCPPHWPVATFIFEGDGFLKQMTRNLVGLLVWIAQGKIRAGDIPAIFAAGHRGALPSPTAPAQGLSLMEVMY